MDKEYLQKLKEAHDIICPVCQTKASFEIIKENSFQTVTCGHDEINRIIADRLTLLFSDKDTGGKKSFKFGKDNT